MNRRFSKREEIWEKILKFVKTRLLTSDLSSPIGSFPSQIHLLPSVQQENLPDGLHRNWGACSTDAQVRTWQGGVWKKLETCFSALAYLPDIGNFNGSLVLEAFSITSKNVDLWRLPNRRTPVTGKWSSFFFSIRI